jgi:uncharacterized protein
MRPVCRNALAVSVPSAPSLRPVDDSERIVPVDVLRGVALLGILLMNIQSFSMIGAAYANPTAYGDLHGANCGYGCSATFLPTKNS